MSILKVVEWPAEVLETRAAEVTVFDDKLKSLVKDMFETMHASKGIGLAANQVGVLQRVLVMQIPWSGSRYSDQEEVKEWWHDQPFVFINPKIVKKAGSTKYQEGCLSFPGVYEFVNRAAEVWIEAQDETGKKHDYHCTGLLDICVQHEIDHLDGVVFIDRMSRLKAGLIRKKLEKRHLLESTDSEEETIGAKT